MGKQLTVTLWGSNGGDGEEFIFTDPKVYLVKPDGLLHVGDSEHDCMSFPFTSIKHMESVTSK